MKHQPQPTYSKLQAMLASPTEPMPSAARDLHLAKIYDGLRAIERDAQPTIGHWRLVCDPINMTETLIAMGHAADATGLLQDATTAMAMAGRRHREQGVPIRLDGAGIFAVRAVLEDYKALLEALPHRVVVTCHRETERRMRDVLAGKKRAHDVEVVDL